MISPLSASTLAPPPCQQQQRLCGQISVGRLQSHEITSRLLATGQTRAMLASKEFEWERSYKRVKGSKKKPSLCPIYSKPADQEKGPKLGRPPPSGGRGRKVLGERTNLCDRIQTDNAVEDGDKTSGVGGGVKIGNRGSNFGGVGKDGGGGDGSRSGRRLRGGGKVKHRAVSEPRPPSSTKESNETGETSYHLLPLSPATNTDATLSSPQCVLSLFVPPYFASSSLETTHLIHKQFACDHMFLSAFAIIVLMLIAVIWLGSVIGPANGTPATTDSCSPARRLS